MQSQQINEIITRLTIENDTLRRNYIGLNNAVVQFLETDKKIKDKWEKLHGKIDNPSESENKK